MSTLSEMRSRIADDLDRSDLDSQIDTGINRAIQYYQRDKFWFTESEASLSTSSGQKSYGVSDGFPSDMQHLDYVKIQVSNYDYKLEPRTFDYVQRIDPSNYTGYPQFYAWYQEKLYLYPTPADVYTLSFFYNKNYPELTGDSSSNDFLTNAEDLIESRASWWIYSRVIKDYEAAQFSKSEEQDALKALMSKHRKRVGSGLLQPARM